ncbi:unnamed protein product [Paramecium sonneborni]|uniref:Uncharacterized protein n=1 Tax=Paramecium sonneborni TaxID=65129 RepID=A0A8S1RTZ9_9CILI|nr:unnamed protein product [Paramecium sonneborni]
MRWGDLIKMLMKIIYSKLYRILSTEKIFKQIFVIYIGLYLLCIRIYHLKIQKTPGIIRLHIMKYEHFGIKLVEMQATGLIVGAHNQ